jgi:hypothetical protein
MNWKLTLLLAIFLSGIGVVATINGYLVVGFACATWSGAIAYKSGYDCG